MKAVLLIDHGAPGETTMRRSGKFTATKTTREGRRSPRLSRTLQMESYSKFIMKSACRSCALAAVT